MLEKNFYQSKKNKIKFEMEKAFLKKEKIFFRRKVMKNF